MQFDFLQPIFFIFTFVNILQMVINFLLNKLESTPLSLDKTYRSEFEVDVGYNNNLKETASSDCETARKRKFQTNKSNARNIQQ